MAEHERSRKYFVTHFWSLFRNGCSSFQQCMRSGVLMGRLDAPYRQKDFPLISLEVGIMHLSFVPTPPPPRWGQVTHRDLT